MKELFSKVTKGKYAEIPSIYSADLANAIRMMLQVKPMLRPSCEKILELPIVRRNTTVDDDIDYSGGLLQTIKLLPTLKAIKSKLPAPMYHRPQRNLSAKSNKFDDDKDKENISRKLSKVFSREPSNSSFTPSPVLKLSSRQRPEQSNIFKSKPLIELHPCNQSRLPRVPKSINNSYV